jgi:hypothetical protein
MSAIATLPFEIAMKLFTRSPLRSPAATPAEARASRLADGSLAGPTPPQASWHISSQELRSGLDVIEWDIGQDSPPRWWPAAYSAYAGSLRAQGVAA